MAVILAVDDEANVRFTISEVLEDRGHTVVSLPSASDALERLRGADVVLTDLRMPVMDGFELLAAVRQREPSMPVLMLTARGSERDAVRAMKLGAHDYLTKPFDGDELAIAVERALEVSSLRRNARLAEAERILGTSIVGTSSALNAVVQIALRVAPRDLPVLIRGETGTGKELLGSLVHSAGPRRDGPLVRFNCAAIPLELAEAELFGHRKGAFTGAVEGRLGYFQRADGGTLVLDEIGEMPLSLQPKLLRALQDGEVQPVGATETERVDVRVVACTHHDLRRAASEGTFREDLYYRLAVIELEMPPLRERREDIPILAWAFARRYAQRFDLDAVHLEPALLAALSARRWPGNVRELENTIARLLTLSDGGTVGTAALDEPGAPAPTSTLRSRVAAFERETLIETLRSCRGNRSKAARLLGCSRTTLLDKLKRHGITDASM